MIKEIRQFDHVPEQSIITRNLSGEIDYIDSFSISIENNRQYSIDEITARVFSFPGWVNSLLKLRDALVKPFGLLTGAGMEPQISEPPLFFNIGERAVVFTVIDRSDAEIVMAENDKHLYFRTSLFLNRDLEEDLDELFLTTLVQFHNFWGKLYFTPVKPFHKLIMRALLVDYLNTSLIATPR